MSQSTFRDNDNDETINSEYIKDIVFYVVLGIICIVIAIILYEISGSIVISILLPTLLYIYVAYKKEKKRKAAKRIKENW